MTLTNEPLPGSNLHGADSRGLDPRAEPAVVISDPTPTENAAELHGLNPGEFSGGVPVERVLSTLNSDGSRRWITPRPAQGRFARARRWVAYVLILLFTLVPHLQMSGKPLILLNIADRQFTILGTTFLPTDTLLLALLLVTIFVSVFLMTAVFGRVWCGWACPQTVYMEWVYRPIERLFLGTPGSTPGTTPGAGTHAHAGRKRKALLGGGMLSLLAMWIVFIGLSMVLAHTFLAYFVGVKQLEQWILHSPLKHPAGFAVMLGTTGLMLFDFGFFREQTCILACPYGRFQSVMLDRRSLIVSYDSKRGEPRGSRRRANRSGANVSLPVLGDCVDCKMCVTTCPTGIDIRDGLQMECIRCAQCIDACDSVMDKLKMPRGLIRYGSQASMAGEQRAFIRPRLVVYASILLVLTGVTLYSLTQRSAADITVLRGLGRPFSEISPGVVGNQVRIKIVNRSERAAEYTLAATGAVSIAIEPAENPIHVEPGQSVTTPALITVPAGAFVHGVCEITIHVSDGEQFGTRVLYELLGPGSSTNHDGSSPQ